MLANTHSLCLHRKSLPFSTEDQKETFFLLKTRSVVGNQLYKLNFATVLFHTNCTVTQIVEASPQNTLPYPSHFFEHSNKPFLGFDPITVIYFLIL